VWYLKEKTMGEEAGKTGKHRVSCTIQWGNGDGQSA
jgi:hypothetical protein